jgi:hypothetical protein
MPSSIALALLSYQSSCLVDDVTWSMTSLGCGRFRGLPYPGLALGCDRPIVDLIFPSRESWLRWPDTALSLSSVDRTYFWSIFSQFRLENRNCPQLELPSQSNRLKSAVCPQEDVAPIMDSPGPSITKDFRSESRAR